MRGWNFRFRLAVAGLHMWACPFQASSTTAWCHSEILNPHLQFLHLLLPFKAEERPFGLTRLPRTNNQQTAEDGCIHLELLELHIQPANSAWGKPNPEWVLSKPVAKQQLRFSTSAVVLHHNVTRCQNTQKQTHTSKKKKKYHSWDSWQTGWIGGQPKLLYGCVWVTSTSMTVCTAEWECAALFRQGQQNTDFCQTLTYTQSSRLKRKTLQSQK